MDIPKYCTGCGFKAEILFHAVIGYGVKCKVTRVDLNIRYCHDCIDRCGTYRPIGRIVDWQVVEREDDD